MSGKGATKQGRALRVSRSIAVIVLLALVVAGAGAPTRAAMADRGQLFLEGIHTSGEPSVADVDALTESELRKVIPELIHGLSDATVVAPAIRDRGETQVRHHALSALELAAGFSMGWIPRAHGMVAVPPGELDRSAAHLTEVWTQWWERARDKHRSDWIEDRRPRLLRILLRAMQQTASPVDRYIALRNVRILRQLDDRDASVDLVEALRVGVDALVPVASRHDSLPSHLVEIVEAIGELGNLTLVPELVEIARAVNRPVFAEVAGLPGAHARALDSLTGLDTDSLYPVAYEGHTVEIIAEKSFDRWIHATAQL